jgi:tripartite-type tricarboxylate transporter receptor subunit TctC
MTPVEPERATPEALEAFLRSEIDKWGKIIKAAGIEPQ